MDLLFKIAVLGVIVAAGWSMVQPRYRFVIQIKDGSPRVSKGKVAQPFLTEVGEVCTQNGVRRGWVGGVQQGSLVALRFSRSVPPPCRQQLRNAWMFHR